MSSSLLRKLGAASAVLALLSCSARPDVEVVNGWARESAPGQATAAAYFTVTNAGNGDDRLVEVSSPAAAAAALHSSSSADGVARMRALGDGLAIPARSTVELKPGGTHVMLMGLRQPLTAGGKLDLELRFAASGRRAAQMRIVPATAYGANKCGIFASCCGRWSRWPRSGRASSCCAGR